MQSRCTRLRNATATWRGGGGGGGRKRGRRKCPIGNSRRSSSSGRKIDFKLERQGSVEGSRKIVSDALRDILSENFRYWLRSIARSGGNNGAVLTWRATRTTAISILMTTVMIIARDCDIIVAACHPINNCFTRAQERERETVDFSRQKSPARLLPTYPNMGED